MPVLPAYAGLQLETTTTTETHITITASITAPTARCPDCDRVANRIHSAYHRRPRDLPWSGMPVQFVLHVRRFFCDDESCARTTFVEQLTDFLRPYAQRTHALNASLQTLGLALGGEAGASLGTKLGLVASADTILRRVHAMPPPTPPPPRVVGIDEWAIRKGRRYGSIIVDLERQCPIALLPEHTPEAITIWFADHPTIKIIARDRASIYTEALAKGAPDAEQVADRWHLTQNLGTALQNLLAKHTKTLRTVATALTAAKTPTTAEQESGAPIPELPPLGHTVGPEEVRHHQFVESKRLYAAGWSLVRIAKELQINRRTARKYVHAEAIPRRVLPQATSQVTPYLPYLRECWIAGCQQGTQLLKALQAHGYRGSLSSIYRALKAFRTDDDGQTAPLAGARVAARSPRQAMWLLVRAESDLSAADMAYRDALFIHEPLMGTAATLGVRLLQMIRERQADHLDGWLKDAEESGIAELRNLAHSLRGDYAPVKAALTSPWSNGQTEGNVNRLKMIKRTMYGRASFELLRNRVLSARS